MDLTAIEGLPMKPIVVAGGVLYRLQHLNRCATDFFVRARLVASDSSRYGFNVKNATPYPGKVTVRRDAGVTPTPEGPNFALVVLSIESTLPEK